MLRLVTVAAEIRSDAGADEEFRWWAAAFDQSTFDYVSERFAEDFGGLRPFIVREQQWATSRGDGPPQPLLADGMYAWGAAVFGFNPDQRLTVAQVGPGFTNTAICRGGPRRVACPGRADRA